MQNSHAAHDLLVSKLLGDDAHVQYIQFRQVLHEHIVVVDDAHVDAVGEQSLQPRMRLACHVDARLLLWGAAGTCLAALRRRYVMGVRAVGRTRCDLQQ